MWTAEGDNKFTVKDNSNSFGTMNYEFKCASFHFLMQTNSALKGENKVKDESQQ